MKETNNTKARDTIIEDSFFMEYPHFVLIVRVNSCFKQNKLNLQERLTGGANA